MTEKFRGYTAVRCENASWRDYENSKRPLEYYKLDLITPYSADMEEDDLLKRLQCDLGEIFGDIGHFDHVETNKRAFKMENRDGVIEYAYECFGINSRINFKHKRWEATLFLHHLFRGFDAS